MIRTRALQENFSRASGRYDAHALLQHTWRTQLLQEARALFPVHARVLDVGCGTGGFAREAPKGWQVHGIDLAWGMCAQSGAIQADACQLPIADQSIDGVVSSLCLQWVENKALALQEIARVLRPGAPAIIMTLGADTLNELRVFSSLRLLPLHPLARYVEWAEQAGLQVMAAQASIEYHPYPSVSALLRSFRAIGAQAAFHAPARALSRADYASLRQRYQAQHPHEAGGVGATWQPLLMVLRKPERV